MRKLVVPIAVYVAVTLILPIANGAAGRADFARHAALVLVGCAAVVAVAAIGGLAVATIARLANNRRRRRVAGEGSMRGWTIPIAIAILGVSTPARADQCEVVSQTVAAHAVAALARVPDIVTFCEPCGDVAPGAPEHVKNVGGHADHVEINGRSVDLAYTYVETSPHRFENLAALAGCPTTGVSPSLRADDATSTGVLIHADSRPVAVAPPPPTAPQTITVPSIYVVQVPAPAMDWVPTVLACGGAAGASALWASLALIAARRRRSSRRLGTLFTLRDG